MSDELLELLKKAHQADVPPSFAAIVNRQPKRLSYRTWIPALAAVIALVIGVTILQGSPRRRPPSLRIAQNGLPQTPLDFLLQPQGQEIFSETPRFDARGLP